MLAYNCRMSCCRTTESDDVIFYKKLDEVARTLAANPERFKADLTHPVKNDKLHALRLAIQKVYFVE